LALAEPPERVSVGKVAREAGRGDAARRTGHAAGLLLLLPFSLLALALAWGVETLQRARPTGRPTTSPSRCAGLATNRGTRRVLNSRLDVEELDGVVAVILFTLIALALVALVALHGLVIVPRIMEVLLLLLERSKPWHREALRTIDSIALPDALCTRVDASRNAPSQADTIG